MGRTATTVLVWERLMKLFVILGYPNILRTDMGPEFRDRFTAICGKFAITHQACSVENHQSNGSTERTVKTCKVLIRKCLKEGSCWQLALLYLNTTPRGNGMSPGDMLLRRRPRSLLPDLRPNPSQEEIEEVAED